VVNSILLGAVGTLISVGIAALIKGQNTIKTDATAARIALNDKVDCLGKKVDKYSEKVNQLETAHKINHLGQL